MFRRTAERRCGMILNPVIAGGAGDKVITATLDYNPKNGVRYTFLDENGSPRQVAGTGVHSMRAGMLIAEYKVDVSSPFFSGDIFSIADIDLFGTAAGTCFYVTGDFRIYN